MAGERLSGALEVLFRFVGAVEAAGLRYVVVGSVASSVFGEPRATRDSDVVVAMEPRDLPTLLTALGPEFHAPKEASRTGVASCSPFGVAHMPTLQKVDVFPMRDADFDRELLDHLVRVRIGEQPPRELWILGPEMVVASKLRWYRRAHSTEQWRDVLGVLKVQTGRLDPTRLERAASHLGVTDLLARALGEAGHAGGDNRRPGPEPGARD